MTFRRTNSQNPKFLPTKAARAFITAFVATFVAGLGSAAAFSDVSYTKSVQPIFNTYCIQCHQPGGKGFVASGLDLGSYATVMKGTKHGRIVVPGDSFTSNLMAVIEGRTDKSISMPHNAKRDMTKADRRILRKWVVDGATEADYNGKPAKVIAELCLHCHVPGGEGYKASGLDMRTYTSLMKGTQFGPVIVPGDSVTSNMLVLIDGRAMGGLKMPHNALGEPSRQDRVQLRRWINQGAKNN